MPWPYPWDGGNQSAGASGGQTSNTDALSHSGAPWAGLGFLAPAYPELKPIGEKIAKKALPRLLPKLIPGVGLAVLAYEAWEFLNAVPPRTNFKDWITGNCTLQTRKAFHCFQGGEGCGTFEGGDECIANSVGNPNYVYLRTQRNSIRELWTRYENGWLIARRYWQKKVYNSGFHQPMFPTSLMPSPGLYPGTGTPLPNLQPDSVPVGEPASFPRPIPYPALPAADPAENPLPEAQPQPSTPPWVEVAPGVTVRPSPIPGALPDVIITPAPGPGSVPAPGAGSSPAPGPGEPMPQPEPAGPTPPPPVPGGPGGGGSPGKDVVERKVKRNAAAEALLTGVNAVTESADAINAIWEALPAKCKTRKKGTRTSEVTKMGDIYRCQRMMDLQQGAEWLLRAGENLAHEAREDATVALMAQPYRRLNKHMPRDLPIGTQAGPWDNLGGML